MAEGFGLLNQRAHKCTMGSNPIFSEVYDHKTFGDVLQLVECMLCKHKVTGSSPVVSSAFVAQLAEHSYGKGKVPGSNPAVGSQKQNIYAIYIFGESLQTKLYSKSS